MCQTWSTSQKNLKAEYPWRQSNVLYLVGSEGIMSFLTRMKPLMKNANSNNSSNWSERLSKNTRNFRLDTIIFLHDGAWPQFGLLPLMTIIYSGRCRILSLYYSSRQNKVAKIGLFNSWMPNPRSSFGIKK